MGTVEIWQMAKTCLWWANSLKSFSPTTLQFWSEHYLKLKSKTLQKSLSKFLAHQWRDQIYHSLDVIDWCEGCMLLGMFKLPHLSFILADLLVILENFNIHLLYNLTFYIIQHSSLISKHLYLIFENWSFPQAFLSKNGKQLFRNYRNMSMNRISH